MREYAFLLCSDEENRDNLNYLIDLKHNEE